MTDLQSLIARVEAATGPCKEINRMIAKTQGWVRVEPRFMNNTRGGWIAPEDFIGLRSDGSPIFDSMHGTTVHQEVPAYTSSIDAALTLVPEGQGMKLDKYWIASVDGPVWHAAVTSPSKNPNVIVGSDYNEVWDCQTPALALCLAALRARAAQGEG